MASDSLNKPFAQELPSFFSEQVEEKFDEEPLENESESNEYGLLDFVGSPLIEEEDFEVSSEELQEGIISSPNDLKLDHFTENARTTRSPPQEESDLTTFYSTSAFVPNENEFFLSVDNETDLNAFDSHVTSSMWSLIDEDEEEDHELEVAVKNAESSMKWPLVSSASASNLVSNLVVTKDEERMIPPNFNVEHSWNKEQSQPSQSPNTIESSERISRVSSAQSNTSLPMERAISVADLEAKLFSNSISNRELKSSAPEVASMTSGQSLQRSQDTLRKNFVQPSPPLPPSNDLSSLPSQSEVETTVPLQVQQQQSHPPIPSPTQRTIRRWWSPMNGSKDQQMIANSYVPSTELSTSVSSMDTFHRVMKNEESSISERFHLSRGAPNRNQSYRPRWKRASKMMNAYEIDTLIRIHEAQLRNFDSNPFVEDYYYQKMQWTQREDRPVLLDTILHRPLFESSSFYQSLSERNGVPLSPKSAENSFYRRKTFSTDPMEGVLGRIPSHSVRAPRVLLQLPSSNVNERSSSSSSSHHDISSNAFLDEKSSLQELSNSISGDYESKDGQNREALTLFHLVLLTIENCFIILLDLEDLDFLIKASNSQGDHRLTMEELHADRELLENLLFSSLHVFAITPPFGHLTSSSFPDAIISSPVSLDFRRFCKDSSALLFVQDELLLYLSLLPKGRCFLCRAFALLSRVHLVQICFAFLRNLALLVTSPYLLRHEDNESLNALITHLVKIISFGDISQSVLALQTFVICHSRTMLLQALSTKLGLSVVSALFKKGHELRFDMFSTIDIRDPNLPVEIRMNQPLLIALYHWKETTRLLLSRIAGQYQFLFSAFDCPKSNLSDTRCDPLWEFFSLLFFHADTNKRKEIAIELSNINIPQTNARTACFELITTSTPSLFQQR